MKKQTMPSYIMVFILVAVLYTGIHTAYGQVNKSPVAPDYELVQSIVEEAYHKFKNLDDGAPASYIPELAKVKPDLFGISIVTVDGIVFSAGDVDHIFAIESVSKAFTLAMVMERIGKQGILDKLGAEPTGFPFNSVLAVEFQKTRVGNPLVNAGAMATASLITGKSEEEKWHKILDFYSNCAGERLHLMQDVYASEAATNQHNVAIAWLLDSYGIMYSDPEKAVDLYTKQCSVGISCKQLAAMGATFAAGGINPFSGDRVFSNEHIPNILSLMLTAGLYDYSGTWSYLTGLPSKSGVGGGIVSVVPGKGAIAAFSPRLDEAGNSIRAQKAIAYISEKLNINIFAPQSVGVE